MGSTLYDGATNGCSWRPARVPTRCASADGTATTRNVYTSALLCVSNTVKCENYLLQTNTPPTTTAAAAAAAAARARDTIDAADAAATVSATAAAETTNREKINLV